VKRLALTLAVAMPLALAACGDDETTTVTESDGPSGPLTTEGVGEAVRGSSEDEVAALFGEPTRKQTGPGCELDGSNATPTDTWTYGLTDGRVVLSFDSGTKELGSYRTDSPSLETEKGDSVGEPFSTLKGNWGGELTPLSIGVKSNSQEGLWQVGDIGDGEEALLFEIQGGRVTGISGGHIEICE
jgi:hypothetical protein